MLLHSQQLPSLIVLQLNISYLPSNLFLIILQTQCSGMHNLLEQSGSIWTIVWMLPFAKTVETKSISHYAIGNLLILWVTLVAVLAWTKQIDLSSFLLWYQLHPGDEEKLMVELIQSYNTNNTLSSIYNIKLDIYSEMLQSWKKNSWYIWCNLFQVSHAYYWEIKWDMVWLNRKQGVLLPSYPFPLLSINAGGSGKASDNMTQINITLGREGSLFPKLAKTKCANIFSHDHSYLHHSPTRPFPF